MTTLETRASIKRMHPTVRAAVAADLTTNLPDWALDRVRSVEGVRSATAYSLWEAGASDLALRLAGDEALPPSARSMVLGKLRTTAKMADLAGLVFLSTRVTDPEVSATVLATLADALLYASGTIKHKASVLEGNSVSDFEKEEKEQK